MDEETIKALIEELDNTEELFFISKVEDEYKFIHSELTDLKEWTEMVGHFNDKLKEKIAELNRGNDATDDLLDNPVSSN